MYNEYDDSLTMYEVVNNQQKMINLQQEMININSEKNDLLLQRINSEYDKIIAILDYYHHIHE